MCAKSWTGWRAISKRHNALLREAVNIGRRCDFLVQEFNREANTLCSKSASTELSDDRIED